MTGWSRLRHTPEHRKLAYFRSRMRWDRASKPEQAASFMKSSRSRSRNKSRNNNRPSGGNIVNRVFDSSGPEGKVRGTPQQIVEKYTQLHRDAILSNDRVNAENFAQHAEHYTRLLAEAQKEIDAKREEQEKQNRERQAERDEQDRQNRERQAERDRERDARLKAQEEAAAAGGSDQPTEAAPEDSGLVETPEEAPKKRRTRKPRPRPEQPSEGGAAPEVAD